MEILFSLSDDEKKVTPMGVAEALIEKEKTHERKKNL